MSIEAKAEQEALSNEQAIWQPPSPPTDLIFDDGEPWFRFYDIQGNLILLPEEAERRQAEQEQQRAEQERQRAERLAERLRELGQDPDKNNSENVNS